MTEKICAFTGHRPQNLKFLYAEASDLYISLKKAMYIEIERLIKNENVTHFITGMALGIDMLAAQTVLDLKNKYPNIILHAAIPCDAQSEKWRQSEKERYNEILDKCNRITYVRREYTPDCMRLRNQYMVDKCDILLAVWNGKTGGTSQTVKYAKKCDKQIIVLNPETLEIKQA